MDSGTMLTLQSVQGKLFENSLKRGFASEQFINAFMRSRCAADLDMEFNRLQWLGEEYIMEELIDEAGDKLIPGKQYSEDALYWIGYIYRYWHFHTSESSKEIVKQASARDMAIAYPGMHTENMDLAIEDLKLYARGKVYVPPEILAERGERNSAPSLPLIRKR
ncbi:MAG: hypothetical protein LBE48_05490 [Methanomassiliicoccaceae archaeon]|jgi:hypothetical protein|nr:hypothetical protein [Methanomassiliicoccaceae archaeon]